MQRDPRAPRPGDADTAATPAPDPSAAAASARPRAEGATPGPPGQAGGAPPVPLTPPGPDSIAPGAAAGAGAMGDDALSQERVAELVEEFESEAPTRKVSGRTRWIVGALAIG